MSTFQILFLSLFLMVISFSAVKAEDAQITPENDSVDQVASEQAVTEQGDVASDRSAVSKSLFEGRCQMCHQLPEPSMLRPNQWKLILGTMQQRMQQAGVPQLTEEETEMILEYIAEQSS